MGLEIGTLMLIGGGLMVAGTVAQIEGQRKASNAQEDARGQQMAQNASEAARERRQQIREERVKRAQILQSASNTGVSDSSGAAGAVGSLSTNLSSNIGTNIGRIESANRISMFEQTAADAMFMASVGNQVAGIGGTIFGNAEKLGK